ncbi:hypothetical protein SDC9_30436 [bioreactor metagenome]|uniref:Uncharacterized protein n=1 Tax=bioreactor metagenome TaxID=1076179 RepID=A0A644UZV8_9ZZZZ
MQRFGIGRGGNLGLVEAEDLGFGGHAQLPDRLEEERQPVARDEAERDHHQRTDQLAEEGGVDGALACQRRIALRRDADDDHAPEAEIHVHGNRADRVVDFQPLDEGRDEGHGRRTGKADHEGHRRIPQIKPRGAGDDPAQRARHHPERIAGNHPGTDDAAGHAHQRVEGHPRKGHRRAVDRVERRGRPRPGLARDDHAAHQEAPEAGDDQHQPDQRHRHRVTGDRVRAAVRVELADPRPEVDDHAQREGAGDQVHDTGGAEVMIAELGDQPAIRMPAPGGGEDPDETAQHRRQNDEAGQTDTLDQRAREDRGGGRGEHHEGAPEHAVRAVIKVRPHEFRPGRCDRICVVETGDPGRTGGQVDPRRKGPVDPPADEVEERHDHREGEDVLDAGRQRVLRARGAHLIGEEPDMDQHHERDRQKVEGLGEGGAGGGGLRLQFGDCRRQCCKVLFHVQTPC